MFRKQFSGKIATGIKLDIPISKINYFVQCLEKANFIRLLKKIRKILLFLKEIKKYLNIGKLRKENHYGILCMSTFVTNILK
jgi:hypothetical protein